MLTPVRSHLAPVCSFSPCLLAPIHVRLGTELCTAAPPEIHTDHSTPSSFEGASLPRALLHSSSANPRRREFAEVKPRLQLRVFALESDQLLPNIPHFGAVGGECRLCDELLVELMPGLDLLAVAHGDEQHECEECDQMHYVLLRGGKHYALHSCARHSMCRGPRWLREHRTITAIDNLFKKR